MRPGVTDGVALLAFVKTGTKIRQVLTSHTNSFRIHCHGGKNDATRAFGIDLVPEATYKRE